MKKLFPHLAGLAFVLFAIGVFFLIVTLTYSALGRMFPNDPITQLAGVALFDFAALVWFGVFIYKSKSQGQYISALLGFAIGLLGSFGMIAIETAINAGMVSAEEMSTYLVYVFIIASLGHMICIYAHHALAPEIDAQISLGIETAKIRDEGMKQAENILINHKSALGQNIANALVAEALSQLNIKPTQIINLPALPTQEDEPKESFFGNIQNKVKNLWSNNSETESEERKFNADVPIAELNINHLSDIQNSAPTNAGKPMTGTKK